MLRKRCTIAVFMWFSLFAVAAAEGKSADSEKTSKPLDYSGYTSQDYDSLVVSSNYVTMSDSEMLAIDVYLPADGPPRARFPVVLFYTPYQRSKINPETGEVMDLRSGRAKFFTSYGYAVVCADIRGTGASTGWLLDFMPRIWDDGKELVDWIAAQSWCDGNVGMAGGSYLGWSQTATASRQPEALKCIAPAVIPLDGYTGEIYPGGIYLDGFMKLWSGGMYHLVRNKPDSKNGFYPAKPALDEDGDGELADEIPVDVDGSGSFLDDGFPPKYRDGQPRKHVYYEATREHDQGDYDYAEWASKSVFIDGESPLGLTAYELGPNAHVPGLMASGIPIYNFGGWFDGFARGSFELYSTLKSTNPSKIIMTPGYHNIVGGPFWEHLGEDREDALGKVMLEHVRFFDRYLKGIDNGIDREPPIYIYVMNGGGWRAEEEWPLSRQKMTRFYFENDHRLTESRPASGHDTYRTDFSHSSAYGERESNRWLGIGGKTPDSLPDRTGKDAQCLVYTSSPVTGNTEVTGHPIVHLWVSSTADYGDFFVYLEDVDKAGRALLVTEGQLRAGFAGLHDNDEIIASGAHGIDVVPELPWHGFEKAQYVDGILADGRPVELVIDFHPTSWVFREGHRIRVSIACADHPTFLLHPNLVPTNKPDDPGNIVPTITVYRDELRASFVELPVISDR